jgi:hypothetical protein
MPSPAGHHAKWVRSGNGLGDSPICVMQRWVCSDAEWIEHGSQADQPPGACLPVSVAVISSDAIWLGRMGLALDYMERLRRLAINDARDMELGDGEVDAPRLDSKTLELVRLAALVAVGGAVLSYGP